MTGCFAKRCRRSQFPNVQPAGPVPASENTLAWARSIVYLERVFGTMTNRSCQETMYFSD
jgi:hypothetical protein